MIANYFQNMVDILNNNEVLVILLESTLSESLIVLYMLITLENTFWGSNF